MIDGLITLNCEQGSDEWLTARLGIPTGTGIKNIVTAEGKKGNWTSYLAELIAERYEGIHSEESFKSAAMERGNRLEAEARRAYEFLTDNQVTEVGGVYLNEEKQLMISPDGLIPHLKKGIEIKCPKMKTHIETIIENDIPTKYIIQVQSAMWVTGYKEWDFISYCPEFTQPIFIKTIKRNEKLMRAFNKYVPDFLKTLDAFSQQTGEL